jgi:pimeloyl-ACP methyl ester carboxylesterase
VYFSSQARQNLVSKVGCRRRETDAKAVRPFLPPGAELITFENTGHFIHIEHPRRVADLVLEFLS